MIYGSRIEDRGPNAMQTMAKEYINPESLFRSVDHGFSQAVAASGRRTLYVSGQTAWDPSRQLVGGMDLAAQARQAFRNLQIVVEAGGGTLADVGSLRLYMAAPSGSPSPATRSPRRRGSGSPPSRIPAF